MLRKIERALISVSDKTDLVEFAKTLKKHNVEVLSTGGTAKILRAEGLNVIDVSEHTDFPEMLDGRVKTLHPKVHGGILGIRDNAEHQSAMAEHNITNIDLVVVNLYPFEETVAKGGDFSTCIENIDIGGPSMVRSAAKNHNDVAIIIDPSDYAKIAEEMDTNDGATDIKSRRYLAAKAFSRTASYDAAIGNWFATQEGHDFAPTLVGSATLKEVLRYGENPDQKAAVYTTCKDIVGITNAEQIQGKALSYNNINDADAALEMVADFPEPTAAIIKHANPCGMASGATIAEAYDKALACDPVSAFGGIIALNRDIDGVVAKKLSSMFVEVIIAPNANAAAREIFAKKKNLRVLLTGKLPDNTKPTMQFKSIAGGMLVQDKNIVTVTEKDIEVVTKRQPTDDEVKTMLFAFSVCKHVKSNAIVFAKNQATIGIGAGQMSRVDSVRIAALKSADGEGNTDRAKGAVVASDAFFPFADGLITAYEAGCTAAIQPGGSIRDEEVIKAADERGMAMVTTGGKRHFKH